MLLEPQNKVVCVRVFGKYVQMWRYSMLLEPQNKVVCGKYVQVLSLPSPFVPVDCIII
jgi:hypothetical protein